MLAIIFFCYKEIVEFHPFAGKELPASGFLLVKGHHQVGRAKNGLNLIKNL